MTNLPDNYGSGVSLRGGFLGDLQSHAGSFFRGMVNQIVYRIESWLYREYPGIRPNREKSIELQAQMPVAGLAPHVERHTPHPLYEGSNAVNYAYLRSVGIMLGRNLIRDYRDPVS